MTGLRNLAGALALCLLSSASAMAADQSCATRAALAVLIAERLPQARVMVLEKAEARLFLATVNRIAPVPLTADEIVIVDGAPAAPAVRVVLFEAGCMTRVGNLPRAVVRAILIAIARGGA